MLISGENIPQRERQGQKIQVLLGVCEEVGSMWDQGMGSGHVGERTVSIDASG